MKVKHFGGVEFARSISDLSEILAKRYGAGVNEFWLSDDSRDDPCLAILVNKEMANLTYFPSGDSVGFQSAGRNAASGDAFIVFYTNTPEEEIEISCDSVISTEEAVKAAEIFFETHEMPDNIEWTEN